MHRSSAVFLHDAPPATVEIQNVRPQVDCGRYAVKREVGDTLRVTADIFKDGHDKIAAVLRLRRLGEDAWVETDMAFVDNDMWRVKSSCRKSANTNTPSSRSPIHSLPGTTS